MIKMSFRNIYRNGKRSLLTGISIAIGVAGIVIAFTYLSAMEALLLKEGTKITGDIRITAGDYDLRSKTLDISSNIDLEATREKIAKIEGIKETRVKIRFGSYIFKDEDDRKALGTGIEKKEELEESIYEGKNLDFENGGKIVIGAKLREKLKININDEITVMSSSQNGSLYALNYKVVGFYTMNEKLDNGFYISLNDAQYLLDMEGYVTEFLVYLDNIDKSALKKLEILKVLDESYLVKIWSEIGINSTVHLYIFVKIIMIVVVGLLAGLAITNTMMMAVFERRKEIGVLKSMGMSERKIFYMFSIEASLIGIFGSIIGIIIGGYFAYFFSKHGIVLGEFMDSISSEMNLSQVLYTELNFENLFIGFLSGTITSIIAGSLPLFSINKQEAVDNLRD